MEARHHPVVQERIGERDDDHTLVVREEGLDRGGTHRALRRFAIRGLLGLPRRVVQRFEEPELPFRSLLGQAPQIVRGLGGIDHRREGGGIRRDHQILRQAPLQTELGNAECLVLVRPMPVHDVERGFGNSPGHAVSPPVGDLCANGGAARTMEQRVRVVPHEEERHEVLEHRSAPGDQGRNPADAHETTPQLEPMLLGDVPLRDRDEAGETGLGREQIVVGGIEPSRTLLIRQPVPDGENPAIPVVQEREVHRVRDRLRAIGQLGRTAAILLGEIEPDVEPLQSFCECEQGARQIRAVHRRDVARLKRRQAPDVVPVQQMPLVLLEALDRRDGLVDSVQSLEAIDEAQVVRRQDRQKRHADVRRRRAVGHEARGLLLNIVRRKPMPGLVHRAHEIRPGAPRDLAQVFPVARAEDDRSRNHRAAQPERDERRRKPGKEEERGGGEGRGARRDRGGAQGDRGRGACPHAVRERAQALPAGQARRARRRGGRGLPFEQLSLREHQPHQRERDGVDHLVGVIGQERELEDHLRARGRQLVAQVAQEHPERLMLRGSAQTAPRVLVNREPHAGDHRERPRPGGPRQPGP